jgi:hypothetical protein
MTASPQAKTEIPIVLTGTVIPNGVAAAFTPQVRLAEYVKALKFYVQFAPIIFLENSGYPLEQHPEFCDNPRLQVKQFPPSATPKRGKGYQEFEMLDAWLAAEPHPPVRWLKISGRYQICNIDRILKECRTDQRNGLLIDQLKNRTFARTYLFCVDTDFYRERLRGLYRQCDDQTGNWIERVLFLEMKEVSVARIRSFKTQPYLAATGGASGRAFPSGRGQWLCKQILRSLNRLLDRKYLRYQLTN